ncbi:hypothetical protein N7510_004205 [Penicillium lagena]|uniref:uncharacterized protein n=1 Tax=Penicillium lagena TaxID=94218 RepID=UPI002541170B|nr:uncharacterized protein N7510_004205 [Penicillium lagena]KAJ5620221.1 hypothetical protein N7510_004205 [Penicillium lagena]
MNETKSTNVKEMKDSPSSTISSRFKKLIEDVRKKWAPLLQAKEDLDDEYNFEPGRYAGQDDTKIVPK